MRERGVFDELYTGLADAVTDIRQKVVEEPWFGRAVTDGPEAPQWPEAGEAEPSFGSSTHTREIEPDQAGREMDLDR